MIEIKHSEASASVTTGPATSRRLAEAVAPNAPLGAEPDAYPGRRVIGVDARQHFARGGGIPCTTQQQPSAI
ncbi:hypothetical protein ARTHRO9V_210138 [Arthrobacter sp. 9V]|nr:hypothetical protein ARTHRO9V_210138 [Arthrobacter sp. 9V]